jgi:hypothetical protein
MRGPVIICDYCNVVQALSANETDPLETDPYSLPLPEGWFIVQRGGDETELELCGWKCHEAWVIGVTVSLKEAGLLDDEPPVIHDKSVHGSGTVWQYGTGESEASELGE